LKKERSYYDSSLFLSSDVKHEESSFFNGNDDRDLNSEEQGYESMMRIIIWKIKKEKSKDLVRRL
jgi:hypothetical protein